MSSEKIPTTIVTGFLGSGKTTLLRHLITNAAGRRLAVIVNEFGEVGVDGDLLRQCSIGCEEEETAAGQLYELSNGCLCCTVQEEFVPVLRALLERRDQIDHILIETSGLALPKPLVQAFQWPEIRNACTVDAVIALVDGPAVVHGRFAEDPEAVDRERLKDPNLDHQSSLSDLFEDQLSAADLVIVNKTDALAADELARVDATIDARTPKAVKVVHAVRGELPLEVVLGLERASEDGIDERHTHHDAHHEEGRDHDHDLFDTHVLQFGELERKALMHALERLAEKHSVYRAKGFVAVPGKPMRLVVQGVGTRFESYFDRPWGAEERRASHLVVIGTGLRRQALLDTLEAALGASLQASGGATADHVEHGDH